MLGICLRIGGAACMAGMAGLAKWCQMRGVPLFEVILFRSLFAFLPLGLYIWRTDGAIALRTNRPLAHVLRASVGLIAMICSFGAVRYLPLSAAMSLAFTAPLFMTALSALVLHEKVGRHRWMAVAVGFVGVLIMCQPQPGHMNLAGGALALTGGLFMAGAAIAIRQMAYERGGTIVFYFTLAGSVMGLIGSLFQWVDPDPMTWGLLFATGLVGGIGQIFMTQSARLAPLGAVAPFDYTQLVWAAVMGFLLWDEIPRPAMLLGAAVVAGSGLYILYRELRLYRQRAQAAVVAG